jgi:hypothetical protein
LKLLLTHARRQDGIALIMAIGILGVLSIVSASLIYYSSTNSRQASYQGKSAGALDVAEAGINQALSVLNNPQNNALDPKLLDANGATSAVDPFTSSYGGGTVSWSGTFDAATLIWTIDATGRVPNPTGAADIVRRYTAKVSVHLDSTLPPNTTAWNYIFATRTGDPDGCDMYVRNNVTGSSRLYVVGNLCLKQNVSITSSPLVVRQRFLLENNAAAGSTGSRIEAYVGGSGGLRCKYATAAWTSTCDDTNKVFSHLVGSTTAGVNYNPPIIEPPTINLAGWYPVATPGPATDCTSSNGARSGTPPTWDTNYVAGGAPDNSVSSIFDITAASSYTCRVGPANDPVGELSWNATTRVLTVHGTMFIDGSAKMNNGQINTYNGFGTLYLTGTFVLGIGTKMCGAVSGSNCANVGSGGWDPNTKLLAIVVNGVGGQAGTDNGALFSQNSQWQGAVYATHSISFENNVQTAGPLIGDTVELINNTVVNTFPLIAVPAGVPGDPILHATPGTPTLYPN